MAKKTATKKPRNRAAQDVNLINLRAVKKRLDVLEREVRAVGARGWFVQTQLEALAKVVVRKSSKA